MARELINTSVGEYIDEEASPNDWDVRGLLDWAQRSFNVNMTQNQLRKMEISEITDWLCEAAEEHYSKVDLAGLAAYLSEDYPQAMLADWCRGKIGIEVRSEELLEKIRKRNY